jgi:hypothetical protein
MEKWWQLPDNVRICGENVYAQHSIAYKDLSSYFYCFSMWLNDWCYSWDETVRECERLDIEMVPVIFRGTYNVTAIMRAFQEYVRKSENDVEGFVVRVAGAFTVDEFEKSVAKFVRKNHVTTDQHWMMKEVVPNQLRED